MRLAGGCQCRCRQYCFEGHGVVSLEIVKGYNGAERGGEGDHEADIGANSERICLGRGQGECDRATGGKSNVLSGQEMSWGDVGVPCILCELAGAEESHKSDA